LVFHSKEQRVGKDVPTNNVASQEEVDAYTDYTETMPASKYFSIENILIAQFLENGRLELKIDVKNIYEYTFSDFDLSATTFIKLKNGEDYCKSYSQWGDDIPEYHISDWKPGAIKTLHIYTPCFNCMGACYG